MENKKIVIFNDSTSLFFVDSIATELQKNNSVKCVLRNHEFILNRADSIDDINNVVNALRTSFFRKSNIKVISTEKYQTKIYNSAWIITIRSIDDDVLGFIAFYANDRVNKFAYISVIAISSKWHRLGLGKLLISIAVSISRMNGMTTLGVGVYKENENACSFYKTLGFNRDNNKEINNDYIPLIMPLI
jgi:ribosomal protein S18 acetylase RimI-like enzyme